MPLYKDITPRTYKEVRADKDDANRRHQVRLAVSEEEYDELLRHSRASGCPCTELVYSIVKRWIDEHREPVPEKI